MILRKFRLLFLLMFTVVFGGYAIENDSMISESSRPVIGSYRLEMGKRFAYASYLSPFSYDGTYYALSGFWTKVLPRNPEHLAMHFEGRAGMGSLLNPARSAREIDMHINAQWGMEWQKRLQGNWLFGVGGNIGVYGGMLYLPRNGNNPVSAQFATGIAASAYISKVVTIGRLPILIADRINLPLLSGFFCQEYGEPYYEIYLGNRQGLAHCGWPGNRFGIDNLLSLTLDFGKTSMEVGYRFSMQNESANNLTTQIFNHAFVIGVVPGGIGLKNRRKNVLTPLY